MNRKLAHIAAWLLLSASLAAAGTPEAESLQLRTMVEADWTAQEARLGRAAAQPGTLAARLASAERLLEHLRAMPEPPDPTAEAATLDRLRREVARADRLDDAARQDLYRRIRWTTPPRWCSRTRSWPTGRSCS